MAIQTLHDTGAEHDIQSKYDGAVYQVATNDCVVGGVGDEFTIQYNANSLTVSFDVGSEAIIGGSFFKITSMESVTLQANSTIYLCANIDTTRPNGERGKFVQRTSSNMKFENVNGTGTSRDLLLYIITTSSTGITSVEDKRFVKGEALKELGFGIDTSRIVIDVSQRENFSWTATEDVWVVHVRCAFYEGVWIDNERVWGNPDGAYDVVHCFPLMKGQTITIPNQEWQAERGQRVGIKAYAVKR